MNESRGASDARPTAEALDEVRSAVLALPQVTDAAVLPWRDPLPLTGRHLDGLLPAPPAVEDEGTAGAAPAGDGQATADPLAGDPAGPAAGPETGPEGRAGRPAVMGTDRLDLPPGYPPTLQAALARAAERAPERGITFLSPEGGSEHLGYRQLLSDAERALGGLRALGARPGDSVLFQFAANRAFVTAYWACVLGGFLPAPLAVVPEEEYGAGRLRNTWSLLDRPLLLTDLDAAATAETLTALWGEPVRAAALADTMAGPRDGDWFPARPDSPALNLLTSGSTGLPKCVRHDHRSLVARSWGDSVEHGLTEDDVTVNWLAMDHVMGSVMTHTRDVFLCCAQVNATPDMFAARPLDWLDWLDRFRATNTLAPNFAFALVNRHAEEVEHGRWDLGALRNVYNGGEPIVSRTAHEFLTLLGRHGLPADAMVPSWGMSETASAMTHTRMHRDHPDRAVVVLDQDSLSGVVRPAGPGTRRTVTFTSVGSPVPGARLRIVDTRGEALPEGRVGRLEVTGATMMSGYFGNPEANAESYTADGWFRTGDLAFVRDGGLVIAGRERDTIIVNGVNHFCHEIEAVVASVPGVAPSSAAVCGLFSPEIGTDRLLVFFVADQDADPGRQTARERARRQAGTARAIRATVAGRTGLAPYRIVPLAAEEFPRTVSGKIQRGRLLASYTSGGFDDRLRRLEVAEEGPRTLPPWFSAPAWQDAPLPAAPAAAGAGPLLLLAGEEATGSWADGAAGPLIVVRAADRGGRLRRDPDGYRIDPEDEAAYRALLDEIGRDHDRLCGIVHAWSLTGGDPEDLDAGLRRGPLSVARLARALADGRWSAVPLLVATAVPDGTVPAPSGAAPGSLANGALVGLVRSMATERAGRTVRLVDAADEAARKALAGALRAELGTPGEPVVRYRGGHRLAARLVPVAVPEDAGPGTAFRAGGMYAVTGGLGGIGREITRHLVADHGARVLLLGRTDATGDRIGALVPAGAAGEVRYARADVTDAGALAAAVAESERAWGRPLAGVLHLAGRSQHGQWDDIAAHTVERESLDVYREVFAPKVAGTLAVARLLQDRPDAWLLLFSSVNGRMGGTGFGAYAAASSFQDAFAAAWSAARGRDVRALAWSQWSGVGMNAGGPASAVAAARGFRPITPARGLGSLTAVRAMAERHLLIGLDPHNPEVSPHLVDAATRPAVLVGYTGAEEPDRVRRAALAASGGDVPVLVAAASPLPRTAGGEADAAVLARLALREGGQDQAQPPAAGLESDIAQALCAVLGRAFIGRDESFFEVGGNSLSAVRAQREVASRLRRELPLRLLYRYPTVRGLAGVLGEG
ncbi:SDR family NAD(P)-dependent oxidoreductase [Streptomyces sp. TS71-3]|uniref:SDR family NAD(P)-dependent oxidoreductase n=1 Tax=Streptomyces sp. TS71-3 TaxID=2733862 RepID=UPI001B028F57|nr:SDR family NAD(P)-dependent oxidoreductase [Streptomyces sp. TS71-3]GHJ41633.1 hypothetical protein Sm713_72420 [Streptomyces sp. TS71-3]